MALAGRPPGVFSWERTNALNALVARRILRTDPPDVLQALADGVERWRRLLEGAADADLGRTALRFGDRGTSIKWIAGAMVPRHIDDHVRNIHAALGIGLTNGGIP